MKMNSLIHFKIDKIELRQAEGEGATDGPGTLVGIACPFDILTEDGALYGFREKVLKGAFAKSLARDNVKALWQHDNNFPLGSTKPGTCRLKESDAGLAFEIDLPNTNMGKDAAISVTRGDVEGMSFRFKAIVQEWDETDPDNVIRTLVEVDLFEISLSIFPAYPNTPVNVRSCKEDYDEYKQHSIENNNQLNQRNLDIKKRSLSIYELD